MKKLFIIGAMGMSLCACKGKVVVNHKDSTECAVYEGWPIVHDEEFETYPVFIPVSDTSSYYQGEKLWLDTNGFVVMPLRDAETGRFVTEGYDSVILHGRMLPNRYELIKQSRS
jgi:hypothetical protein